MQQWMNDKKMNICCWPDSDSSSSSSSSSSTSTNFDGS